jgi:Fe-S-cluster containining protein
MLKNSEIKERLNKIYAKIPDNFPCQHCNSCCGPIIWFKPEEMMIRDYLEHHNMDYVVWSIDEFKKNNMRCPYLKNSRCLIYAVRPLVCRLQGNIQDLPCKKLKTRQFLSQKIVDEIKIEFDQLITQINANNIFYSTKKFDYL